MLRFAAVLSVLLVSVIPVRADEIGQALHDNRWADADASPLPRPTRWHAS